MTITSRWILAASALAAASCFAISPGRAATEGNEEWCAVHDEGAGVVNWDCDFLTIDDCSPAILTGNRGFCARNPYWQPPPPQPSQSQQQPIPLPPPSRN